MVREHKFIPNEAKPIWPETNRDNFSIFQEQIFQKHPYYISLSGESPDSCKPVWSQGSLCGRDGRPTEGQSTTWQSSTHR